MKTIFQIVVLTASLSGNATAEKGDVTIHTVSAHMGAPDGLNNLNFGMGFDVTNNVRIGGFYNSYSEPSAYAAAFVTIPNTGGRLRVGGGAISGYAIGDNWRLKGDAKSVLPFVAAEVDIIRVKRGRKPGVTLGWFGQAINLEVKF